MQLALSRGAEFGNGNPPDDQLFTIRVGSGSIVLHTPCMFDQVGCVRPPRGVQALADLLKGIDQRMALSVCSELAQP